MTSKMRTEQDASDSIEHAAYLSEELTALKHVISAVPYSEKPPGQESILEMIMMIDHAQISYYKPLISRIFSETGSDVKEIDDFRATFTPLTEDEHTKPDEIISTAIENRAALLDMLNRIPENERSRASMHKGTATTIDGLIHEMVAFERNKLREIAERILVIDAGRSVPKHIQA